VALNRKRALIVTTMGDLRIEIVDSELQLASDDQFGAISAASLQLRGCVLPMQFRYEQYGNESTYEDGIRALIGEDGSSAGAFYPDIMTKVRDMKWVYCLSIKGRVVLRRESGPIRVVSKELLYKG
jgi:hypothetical protein